MPGHETHRPWEASLFGNFDAYLNRVQDAAASKYGSRHRAMSLHGRNKTEMMVGAFLLGKDNPVEAFKRLMAHELLDTTITGLANNVRTKPNRNENIPPELMSELISMLSKALDGMPDMMKIIFLSKLKEWL